MNKYGIKDKDNCDSLYMESILKIQRFKYAPLLLLYALWAEGHHMLKRYSRFRKLSDITNGWVHWPIYVVWIDSSNSYQCISNILYGEKESLI